MKKRILSLLLAVITILQVIPVFTLPAIAEDEATGIDVADMEVGKLYAAEFDYSEYSDFVPYKSTIGENGESLLEWKGIEEGIIEDKAYVEKAGFPQDLIVKRMAEDDLYYLYVANEDWPADYDEYRYVSISEVIVTGEYVAPPADDGLVYGQVGLVMDGKTVTSLSIAEGEKTYVFTELSDKLDGDPTYRWELLIDRESNRWATVQDYVYPYAPISQALIANAGQEDGTATLRCIAALDGKNYVSGELDISVDPSLPEPDLPLIPTVQSASMTPLGADNTGSTRAVEAFQIVVNYTFRHATQAPLENVDNTPAANTFTVTLPAGGSYTGVVTSPPVVGYLPYVLEDHKIYINGETQSTTYDGKTYYLANSINFAGVTEETNIVVYYIPQEVNFLVKFYEQNLHNDEYVLAGTTVGTGYADAAVGEKHDVERTGFSALYYDPNVAINGDGTTVVDIYYDRNYYLIDFELGSDEAYGATPYYVRYNSQVMLPTPTRPGYDFTEWTLDKVYTVSADDTKQVITDTTVTAPYDQKDAGKLITVQHNADYSAGWDVATTTYTVIYWVENANDDNFDVAGYNVVSGVEPEQTVNAQDDIPDSILTSIGAEKAGLTFIESISDKNVKVKGDGTTSVNVYYKRKLFTLSFLAYATCKLELHTHDGSCQATCTQAAHLHSEECGVPSQTCGKEVHEHIEKLIADGGCISCDTPAHTEHTDACLSCDIVEHTVHTWQCYQYASSTTYTGTDTPGTETEGYVGRTWNWGYQYWIYINGTWYSYSQNHHRQTRTPSSTNASCPNTSLHTHSASCYSDTLHTHTEADGCYKDSAHYHNSACYTYNCGKVEHSHTGGCFRGCTKVEHTSHSNACNSTNSYSVVYAAIVKYGADTTSIWNNAPVYRWKLSQDSSRAYTTAPTMSAANLSTYGESLSGASNKYTIRFYERGTTNKIREDTIYYRSGGSSLGTEDYITVPGFTFATGTTNATNGEFVLQYTRNSYEITFNDGEREVYSKTVPFESDISNVVNEFTLQLPSSKEQGSVKFVGWYTTPTCADGTEFDFTGQIMPINGVHLFAKWEDRSYTANIYLDSEKKMSLSEQTVLFGSSIQEPDYKAAQNSNDAYKNLIFAGWYYMDEDEGEEKRFDFNTMVLKKDMEIYAKWTSKVPVPYTVYYVIERADGELEFNGKKYAEIADRTEGVSLAGISKSFTAKVGTELYDGYRTGYFPEKRSTSILMSNAEANESYFVYSQPSHISYTVTHNFVSEEFTAILGSNTLTLVMETIIDEANDQAASVTISFRDGINEDAIAKATGMELSEEQKEKLWNAVTNLSPDCFEQELILTTGEPNNAVFNWVGRGLASTYQVIHYFQTLDGEYVADYSQQFVANLKDEDGNPTVVEAKPIERYGFVENTKHDKRVPSGEIKKALDGGLILKLYYDRVVYNYTVHHYKVGSTTSLHEDETFTAPFGKVVKYSDKSRNIAGYTLTNGDSTIEISKDGQEITCSYQGKEVHYRYQVSGNAWGGMMDLGNDTAIVDNRPKPSNLTIYPGYVLKRWYYVVSGIEGENDLPSTWLSTDQMTVSPTEAIAEWSGKTIDIYAEVQPTTLTISNTVTAGTNTPDWVIPGQGFIYKIEGTGTTTTGISLTIAVPVDEELTILGLPLGDYSITLEGDWSWRYKELTCNIGTISEDKQNMSFTFNGGENVSFTYNAPGNDTNNGYYITDGAYNDPTPKSEP